MTCRSHAQKYSITNYGVAQGLGQSQVQAIVQDSVGYLWIGTLGGGVSRFDGRSFKNYTKVHGLSSNFVLSLHVMANGNILVGTTRGLCRISKDSILYSFTDSPLDTLVIQDINLPYIATSSGLFKYDSGLTEKVRTYVRGCGVGIYQTARFNGALYAATNKGLKVIAPDGLSCLSNLNPRNNSNFTSLAVSGNNQLWVGSLGGGLSAIQANGEHIFYGQRQGLPKRNIACLYVDHKGNLWIGTRDGGVYKYDGKRFLGISRENGLANDFVNTIFQDCSGQMWFGTSNGISKLNGESYILYDKSSNLPGGGAYKVIETFDQSTWYSTFSGGVWRKKESSEKHYNSLSGFTSKKVKALFESADSTIWFGTEGAGLYAFKNERFKRYAPLGKVWVSDLNEDNDGNLYVATLGNGLWVINKDSVLNYTIENGLTTNRINKVIPDSLIWLATDKGLCYLYQDSIYLDTNVPAERFTSLSKLEDGRLVLGNVGRGLFVYDGKKTKTITSDNLLQSDNVYALFAEQNKLWVGTEKGLDEVLITDEDSFLLQKKHNYQSGFLGIELLRNGIYKDKAGVYWFATVNGLVKHRPDAHQNLNSKSQLLMTGIELFYSPLVRQGKLGNSVALETFGFSYTENHLTFRFQGLDFSSNQDLIYRWKLKGLDNIWSQATTQNFATYAKLPPGEYQFEVQLKQGDSWSESLSQRFTINKPYWQAIWFFLLSIFLALLVIGAIIWLVFRNIKTKNQRKNQALLNQSKMLELEQQALRLQMNPHFLFNSLNAIKGSIAQQKTKEAKASVDQFAKLMRLLLENTKEGYVPLQKELQLIDLYLSLEQINYNFQYTIDVGKELPDTCSIPAMIIQPLVENAVLHGVSPLKQKGKVRISFALHQENMLLCEICDNGIGIEASQNAKISSVHKQKSIALSNIRSRLQILKQAYPGTDLTITGNPSVNKEGTLVRIILPIK